MTDEEVSDEAPDLDDEEPQNVDRDGNEYVDGLIRGKKPKGTRRYVWLGHPTKLHIKAIPHPKTGHLVLRKGDQVDLIPEVRRRHAGYMKTGHLVPVSELTKAGGDIDNLPKPPRRSPQTDARQGKK